MLPVSYRPGTVPTEKLQQEDQQKIKGKNLFMQVLDRIRWLL
jgi:hypothetical protein